MKKKCLLLLMCLLLLVSASALAQRPSRPSRPSAGAEQEEESARDSEEAWQEHLLEEAKQDRLEKLRRQYVSKQKDYDQNTVCSFGPQFRDVTARLTDEWYMFTPLDLSEDGTQSFDLIAGNMYVIGEVSVTVEDGSFRVDYRYNSTQIQTGREYFNVFSDYESIEAKNLENLHAQKRFTYGKPYSIADKLEGDTDVILFVCNTATFRSSTPGISRYYSRNPEYEQLREEMLNMVGK